MGEIRLFHVIYDGAHELVEIQPRKEKEIQELFEENLSALIDIEFLESERSTSKGQPDTLGIDGKNCPVVIEFKKKQNVNIITQGIRYLTWVKNRDNYENIRRLVREKISPEREKDINFKDAWLLCVARDFLDQDIDTARDSQSTIELVRYRRFGPDLQMLMLEWVFPEKPVSKKKSRQEKTIRDHDSESSEWNVAKARKELCEFIASLGSDVEVEDKLTTYTKFDRKGHRKSFATVRKDPSKVSLFANMGLDPTQERLVKGFIRDVRSVRKRGIGDLEIRIGDQSQFETAKDLLSKAYRLSR